MAMTAIDPLDEKLMTPGEVAALLRVDPKTVNRWVVQGRLKRVRTPGGHSRFRESEIRALLTEGSQDSLPSAGPTGGIMRRIRLLLLAVVVRLSEPCCIEPPYGPEG